MVALDIIIPSAVGVLSALLTYVIGVKKIKSEYAIANNEQMAAIIEAYRNEIAELKVMEAKHREDIYRLQVDAVKMQNIISSLQLRIRELESELKQYKQ